jgi:phosphoribosylaminoimidazole-succinocarboxamide synthase
VIERGLVSEALYDRAAALAAALFRAGQAFATSRGLILADTKYELGLDEAGTLIVADEIHTPDSSRYWYADGYERVLSEGGDPKALDKEYVRRWLIEERGYQGEGAPPPLPDDVRCEAARRYIEAYERVTGLGFVPDVEPPEPRIRRNLGLS